MIEGSSVTVILLPPEREAELLKLAQEWTASWLIRSAIWVRASDLAPDPVLPEAPPLVHGHVMGRNGMVRVPLFSELSRREYSLLRFIAVRSIEADAPFNALQDQTIRSLEDNLRLSRPHTTKVQFVNLVFAPTRFAGASATHVVEAGWNANILVSPEDRRTANSFDAFTRHSQAAEWTGFVLAHTVTASGLWSTVESGPYDDIEFDGFMEGTHVQRVVVRGVLTGALVVNVGLQALQLASMDVSPLADPLIAVGEEDLRVMSQEEETTAISELVRVTLALNGGQLAYCTIASPPRLEQRRLGLISQAKELAIFGLDKLKDSPGWLSRRVRGRASRKATEELHGDGSDTQVDVKGIRHWEDAENADALAALNRQRERQLRRLQEPVVARRHDIDGRLFEAVRQAGFALIDGSPLPEGHAMKSVWSPDQAAPVVRSVTAIVPDWKDTWEAPGEVKQDLGSFAKLQQQPDHWLDVDFTGAWRDELGRRISRLGERESMLRQRLGSIRLEYQAQLDALEEASSQVDILNEEVGWLAEDLAEYESTDHGEPTSPTTLNTSKESQPASATTPNPPSDLLIAVGMNEDVDGDGQLQADTNHEGQGDTDIQGEADHDEPAEVDEEKVAHSEQNQDHADEQDHVDNSEGEVTSDEPTLQGSHDPEAARLREVLAERRLELQQAEKLEAQTSRLLNRTSARRSRTETALEHLDEQVDRLTQATDGLRDWTQARSGSFAWRLLLRLSEERRRARHDLAQLTEVLSTPVDIKVERAATLQNRFMYRTLTSLGIILLAWTLVILLKARSPELANFAPQVNPIAWPAWVSAMVALLTFVALWILFLITYYRDTSKRRHALRHASSHVEYLGQALDEVRAEIQRLESLHQQMPDYLKYLSEVLHRPWTLPQLSTLVTAQTGATPETPEAVLFDAARPDPTSLPSLMRLAEPPLGAGGEKEAALVRDTVRIMMHRGWRFGALCALLEAAEAVEAVPPGTFDVSRVDRDSRVRSAVMKSLEESDARLVAGRSQLRQLARRIHLQVMDEIHPAVQELVEDPLEGLDLEEDILSDGDWRIKDWDEFLAEAVGPASTWSTATFSLDGLAAGVPDVNSTVYGPERLADQAEPGIVFAGAQGKSVRPIELVVRIDRSPMSLGPVRFRLFESPSPEDPSSSDSKAPTGVVSSVTSGTPPNSYAGAGEGEGEGEGSPLDADHIRVDQDSLA